MGKTLKFGGGVWATKKGSTLAYNDEDGNFKPLPFTYTGAGKGTRVNKEGLIEVVENDKPRIDYTDSEDGVFLLEKAATNLITYSEDFSNSSWVGGSVTRELNQIISPDGTLNATKLSATASFSQIQQSYTSVNNTDYTLSLFVKSPSSNVIGLRLASGTNDVRREFNLSTLSIQSMGGNNQELIDEGIVDFGNGWYRIFLTCKSDGTSSFLNIYPKNSSDATFQSVYVWGAQVEQGNASSYIPTQGAIQTRVQETASGSGNSEVFNDSQGVLFANISALADDLTNRVITISDGTTTNRVQIYLDSLNGATCNIISNNSGQGAISYIGDVKLMTKAALKYELNNVSFWVNGFRIGLDTNSIMPNGLKDIGFDNGVGTSPFYGKTKEIAYYDTALTDLELETLTSYRTWEAMVKELNLNIIHNE